MFGNKMPLAEIFTDWDTKDTLPSIRKDGKYKIKKHIY